MTAIRLDAVSFRRESGFRLGPVSLDFAAGSRTALIGPSGSGKTTLLRCLAGLESPSAGRILFADRDVTRAPVEARRIGYVFQSGALWPHLNALQHLAFVAPRKGREALRAELAAVGLAERENRLPAQLSAGEGKRLALARALAGEPEVLLLDEPLHSVDVHLRDELGLLVRRIATERGLTSIVVTHDRDEALAMADDLVVMREGSIVESGTAEDLLVRPRTSYAAAFVAGATCLPARALEGDRWATAFGEVHGPRAEAAGVELVLLPGDVHAAAPGAGTSRGRVLRVETTPGGYAAVVELEGRSVRVACAEPPRIGVTLDLRLAREPRLLPIGASAPEGTAP